LTVLILSVAIIQ